MLIFIITSLSVVATVSSLIISLFGDKELVRLFCLLSMTADLADEFSCLQDWEKLLMLNESLLNSFFADVTFPTMYFFFQKSSANL